MSARALRREMKSAKCTASDETFMSNIQKGNDILLGYKVATSDLTTFSKI